MPIYTKTGDLGVTSLPNGKRVQKTNCLIEILGDLDELNSILGICLNLVKSQEAKKIIPRLQDQMFSLGSQIAGSKQVNFQKVCSFDVSKIEENIDDVEKKLTPLKNFIIPGGSNSSAFLHLARSVCRRVERHLLKETKNSQKDHSVVYCFINRTSDLLFTLARLENKFTQKKEKYWNVGKNSQKS